MDLFVGNRTGNNFLYRNKGDGMFKKLSSGSIVHEGGSVGCAWGDYDNDGFQDLFVSNGGTGSPTNDFLYHNQGDSAFAKVTSGSIRQ